MDIKLACLLRNMQIKFRVLSSYLRCRKAAKKCFAWNSRKEPARKEILLNQTEIRLYLPFRKRFETKRTYVLFQINQKIVYTI